MDEARKRLRDIHDEVPPDYYDASMRDNLFQRIWHTRRIEVVSGLLKGESGFLLDIGSAGGTLLERIFKASGIKGAVGIDASIEAVRYAAKAHSGPAPGGPFFLSADFYELPFPDRTFALVSAIEVLEHLHDPKNALTEIKRCLKDNGRIVVLVPNENNPLFRLIWWFWTKGKGRVWKEAHVQKFTKGSLKGLLKEAGFRVIETRMFLLGMLMAMKAVKE